MKIGDGVFVYKYFDRKRQFVIKIGLVFFLRNWVWTPKPAIGIEAVILLFFCCGKARQNKRYERIAR